MSFGLRPCRSDALEVGEVHQRHGRRCGAVPLVLGDEHDRPVWTTEGAEIDLTAELVPGVPAVERNARQHATQRDIRFRTPLAKTRARFQSSRIPLSRAPAANTSSDCRAIDALGAVVQGLAGRLGEAEQHLQDGLSQLRMAFVQLKAGQQEQPPAG